MFGSFISVITSLAANPEAAIRLGIDLYRVVDMAGEWIAGSKDAPAEQLAAANEAVAKLQATRDKALEELGQKAPNS